MEKKSFDIALVSPPSRMINHYRPPVGLLYIGGYLQRKGMKVKIIDIPMTDVVRNKGFHLNIKKEIKKIENQMIEDFRNIKTRVVGISFYTPEYFEVFDLARAFKEIDPDVKIIVGGIHPTLYPEEILDEENCPIDFAVIGEGEITTYKLIMAINENSGNYGDIEGIAFRAEKNNGVIKTKFRYLNDDIDEISYPAYNLIDMDYYTNASPYAIRGCFLRSTYILATRGCPSQCTFCVAKKLSDYTRGKKLTRLRSAKSLIREIEDLKNSYEIDSFYFIDDLFTINKKNVLEFCNEIKRQEISVLWGCSSKVSTLNESIIKNMAEAGCVQIDFGVERGSDEALRFLKKGIQVKKIRDVFQLCKKYKIRTFSNYLVNVPGETEDDLKDIVNLMNELNSEIVSLNIFVPYPGTEIYDNVPYKFAKEEYSLLTNATSLIYTYPKKFKFAEHDVNLLEWTQKYMKKYNKLLNNLKFYLSSRYWKILVKSKNKTNYFKQTGLLVKEFINQKIV